jgi:hypothetical protein
MATTEEKTVPTSSASTKKKFKFYVAGRLNTGEADVRDLITFIENQGHEITFDWTNFPVDKPFRENAERSHEAAHHMVVGVMNADIIVVFVDRTGLGLHIETGVALGMSMVLSFIQGREDRKIILVGKDNETSVFYFHKSVMRLPDIGAVKSIIDEL